MLWFAASMASPNQWGTLTDGEPFLVEPTPPEPRILGDHYASVAPILLKCIEHTGQLSGLWLTPDGMANGKFIKELWANRSISLISQNMCHIRLRLGPFRTDLVGKKDGGY